MTIAINFVLIDMPTLKAATTHDNYVFHIYFVFYVGVGSANLYSILYYWINNYFEILHIIIFQNKFKNALRNCMLKLVDRHNWMKIMDVTAVFVLLLFFFFFSTFFYIFILSFNLNASLLLSPMSIFTYYIEIDLLTFYSYC